jgi:hypothetical protein
MRIELNGKANAQGVIDAMRLLAPKGANIGIETSRLCKVRKDCQFTIGKVSRYYVRQGVDYSHLASVRQGIAEGTRGEVESLPWGTWEVPNEVITHKGQQYLRLYPSTLPNLPHETKWLCDGMPVQLDTVKPYLLASELDDSKPATFTVKPQSVQAVFTAK